MKEHSEASGSEGFDLAGFAKKPAACWNEQLLAVMGIRIRGGETCDGASKGSVEASDENGFEDGSFKKNVGLSCGRRPSARRGRRMDNLLFLRIGFRGTRGGARTRDRN